MFQHQRGDGHEGRADDGSRGARFDYGITLNYTGALAGLTAPITVTDPLPSRVVVITSSITNGACTRPQTGQGER